MAKIWPHREIFVEEVERGMFQVGKAAMCSMAIRKGEERS